METLNENGTYDLLVQKHISNEDVELPELPPPMSPRAPDHGHQCRVRAL